MFMRHHYDVINKKKSTQWKIQIYKGKNATMFYMVGNNWVVLHYAFFKLLKIFVKLSKHNTKSPCLANSRVISPNSTLKKPRTSRWAEIGFLSPTRHESSFMPNCFFCAKNKACVKVFLFSLIPSFCFYEQLWTMNTSSLKSSKHKVHSIMHRGECVVRKNHKCGEKHV